MWFLMVRTNWCPFCFFALWISQCFKNTPVTSAFLCPLSLCRDWTRRPSPHRALQHPRLRRLPLAGPVQRSRPPQVRAEKLCAGPGLADDRSARQNTCSSPAGVLPGQTCRVELRGVTSHHPTNVCRNGPLACGQHGWGEPTNYLWSDLLIVATQTCHPQTAT